MKYLQQAGVKADWIDLGKDGVHGNGHMMMLEKNSDVVAAKIEAWINKALPERAANR